MLLMILVAASYITAGSSYTVVRSLEALPAWLWTRTCMRRLLAQILVALRRVRICWWCSGGRGERALRWKERDALKIALKDQRV